VTARVVVVAGPTASGKSARAVAIAKAADAVVLSADAMQVYRGMDVGTGKVTAAEQEGVPHFGLDLVDPDQPFDAADWAAYADGIVARYPRVVVAGGTTLYLRSWLYGLVETPPVDPALRAALEVLPDPHAELAAVDPALAARLHPHDRLRVVRGLEVFRQTGRRLSDLHAAHGARTPRLPFVAGWLDRPDLASRIEARVHAMIAAGYVDEVRRLLDAGYDRTLKPMTSLGYRHLAEHLLDGLPLDEAVRRTIRDTWTFARKQRTWMRSLGWPELAPDRALVEALGG
jgi:tRNA dimethylallyltransferase